jgi:hypothetical protein
VRSALVDNFLPFHYKKQLHPARAFFLPVFLWTIEKEVKGKYAESQEERLGARGRRQTSPHDG